MEKLIYLLRAPEDIEIGRYRDQILNSLVPQLKAAGATQLTINIADLNTEVGDAAPGRLIGPWQHLSAAIALWTDYVDARSAYEASLNAHSASAHGYLVTESVPQRAAMEWAEGARRPGVSQFGALGKPANIDSDDYYHNWQVHSISSFDLHPLRTGYVRNAVARALTPGAPAYRGIVTEHFPELEIFTDDSRYFGSRQAIDTMLEEVAGFCDFTNMVSLGTSEYWFS